MTPEHELKLARKSTLFSIFAYILIATLKLTFGYFWHSNALFADGLNNFADTISSTIMFIGIQLAYKPADQNHQYGHRKLESITTLIVSFIILFIGLQVTMDSIKQLYLQNSSHPDPLTAGIALLSTIIMLGVYWYNSHIAKKINSSGIKATAKDNLADALTSFVTALAIITSQFNLPWMDGVMALIVGLVIIKTGKDIFIESAFKLSDGFSPEDITRYEDLINQVAGVRGIKDLRGRTYGPHVYLDVTILVDPTISVRAGHDITENVEKVLYHTFLIEMIDIHVEPYE